LKKTKSSANLVLGGTPREALHKLLWLVGFN